MRGTELSHPIYSNGLWAHRESIFDSLMYCQKQTNRTNPKDLYHTSNGYSEFFYE